MHIKINGEYLRIPPRNIDWQKFFNIAASLIILILTWSKLC